jgi:Flp pilus assembly protein TadG
MRDLITGLARPMLRLLGRDDRGVVGVLVGILIGGGVLIGMGAMVIDVGQLYQERAELQNGADAAAMAVAKSCIDGACTPSVAATYASDNASALTGGTEAASQVCGSGTLGACGASTGAMTDCPSPPAAGTNYVDVHTSTQTSGGATMLPGVFAKTLLGNGSYSGTTVQACSQAEWGGPASINAIPFTISACTWDQDTSLGTAYAQPPPYPPNTVPPASADQLISQSTGSGTGCATEPAGSDPSGNFGWATETGTCSLQLNASSTTFNGKPGASEPADCKSVLAADQANKTVVYLAVYTSEINTGNNAVFTLKGFAAFVITGFQLPSSSAADWLNPANSCSNNCIEGYFTQGIIPYTGSLSGTYLGAAIIRLTG